MTQTYYTGRDYKSSFDLGAEMMILSMTAMGDIDKQLLRKHQRRGQYVHGKNATDAAKAASVSHVIFSSLVHATEATNGRLSQVL